MCCATACSVLLLDSRVGLGLWHDPHKCGNRLFHGFCDKWERCNRWNPCWKPLLEALSALEPFGGTPAGTPSSGGAPLQRTLPADPSSARTPSSTPSSTPFQHCPRPLCFCLSLSLRPPPKGTGRGTLQQSKGQHSARSYNVFMCCTPWHTPSLQFTIKETTMIYTKIFRECMHIGRSFW